MKKREHEIAYEHRQEHPSVKNVEDMWFQIGAEGVRTVVEDLCRRCFARRVHEIENMIAKPMFRDGPPITNEEDTDDKIY